MTNLIWNDSYTVGVQEIDDQHKKLFSIINSRFDLMKNAENDEKLKAVLKELSDYASYHFSTEEKYFQQFQYEKSQIHISQHDAYKDTMQTYSVKLNSENKLIVAYELMDFLVSWWINHVTGADQEYKECFASHGLK
jgi:hemerythrin-like metal-binding protein